MQEEWRLGEKGLLQNGGNANDEGEGKGGWVNWVLVEEDEVFSLLVSMSTQCFSLLIYAHL